MHRRRVVISGLGVVSGFGVGAEPFWAGLTEARTAIGAITRFDASGFACRHAAEVPDFSGKDHVPKHYRKAVKVMARDAELAVAAAAAAVRDAGLTTRADEAGRPPSLPPRRLGCQIGAGLLTADVTELAGAMVTSQGDDERMSWRRWGAVAEAGGQAAMQNLPPLWLLKYLPNMLACHVTIIHGCEGPSNTILGGEASGLLSVGEGARIIERSDADASLAGGIESKLNLTGFMRLHLAGRLRGTSDGPAPTLAPYDPRSPGTLAGEGGAVLVLEAEETARARGGRMLARIAGFGAGQQLTGLTALGLAPSEQDLGAGLVRAIRAALHDADCEPAQIDAIAPGASGCAEADRHEAAACRAVFGPRLASIPLVTVTPAVGECAAGASSIQLAAAALAIERQILPARLHGGEPAADLLASAQPSRPTTVRTMLVISQSATGQCAAAVLARAG